MLVYTSGLGLNSKLSAQWDYMMGVALGWSGPFSAEEVDTAVLVSPRKQLHSPLTDLPSQYCDVLSDFADKHRHKVKTMMLQGPFVGCSAIQSLTRDIWPAVKHLTVIASPWLGTESVSHLSDSVRSVTEITVVGSSLDALAMSKMDTASNHNT